MPIIKVLVSCPVRQAGSQAAHIYTPRVAALTGLFSIPSGNPIARGPLGGPYVRPAASQWSERHAVHTPIVRNYYVRIHWSLYLLKLLCHSIFWFATTISTTTTIIMALPGRFSWWALKWAVNDIWPMKTRAAGNVFGVRCGDMEILSLESKITAIHSLSLNPSHRWLKFWRLSFI